MSAAVARQRRPVKLAAMNESSPQWKEMADESMVRNLAAQIEAIWPQEQDRPRGQIAVAALAVMHESDPHL